MANRNDQREWPDDREGDRWSGSDRPSSSDYDDNQRYWQGRARWQGGGEDWLDDRSGSHRRDRDRDNYVGDPDDDSRRGWVGDGRRPYGRPGRDRDLEREIDRDFERGFERDFDRLRGGPGFDYGSRGGGSGLGGGVGSEPDRYGRDRGDGRRDEGYRRGSFGGPFRSQGGQGDGRRRGEDQQGLRQSQRGRGPKNYKRSDERISEDVCDRLSDDDELDASDIDVSVSDREVTLSGEVDSKDAKRRAEDCAESCSGVEHVQNNLRVRKSQARDRDQNASKDKSSKSE